MATTRAEFEEVFPKLVEDLIDHAKQYGMPSDALEWYRKVNLQSPSLFTYVEITD